MPQYCQLSEKAREPDQSHNSPCQGPGLSFRVLALAGTEQAVLGKTTNQGQTNQQAPSSFLLPKVSLPYPATERSLTNKVIYQSYELFV